MIALATAGSLLRANWKAVAGGVALLAFAVLILAYKAEQRHSAKVEARLSFEIQARATDRASYRNAQVAAAALNKTKVETIEAEQEKVTNDVKDDYAGDLARLRDELGRVRGKASPAAGRSSPSAGAGQVSKPAEGIGQAPPMCLSTSLILHGAETELQLNALIDWVEAQTKVTR